MGKGTVKERIGKGGSISLPWKTLVYIILVSVLIVTLVVIFKKIFGMLK